MGRQGGAAKIERAADHLRSRLPSIPRIAVVIGSGLSALEAALDETVTVPFSDVPGLPATGVAGHRGAFVYGRFGDAELLVQSGRFHVYEGHPLDVVIAPIRILAALGVETILFTNAAGAIHPLMRPGDVVLVADVINLQFRSPLAGPVRAGDGRFPDMSDPLDAGLRSALRDAAGAVGVELQEGTYAAVTGPAYETRAEVKMLGLLGADLVGMSTVPEVIAAAAAGVRCGALSLVTNRATGLSDTALSHDEVLEMGRVAGERVLRVVEEAVRCEAVRCEAVQSGEAK